MWLPLDQSGTHLSTCYTRGEGDPCRPTADVSAVAYTGSSGSNKGEPAESNSACLKAVSDNIRAVII